MLIKTDTFQGSALELVRGLNGCDLIDFESLTGMCRHRLARLESGSAYPTESEIKDLALAGGVLPCFFNQAWIKPPSHAINISISIF